MKCINCGQELPASANYCMFCGKKQSTVSDQAPQGEEEDRFALHYEYYGGLHGKNCSPTITSYSFHKGTIYHYLADDGIIRKYSPSGDVSYITCDQSGEYGIQVNNGGIFLESYDHLLLLDECGRTKTRIPLAENPGEECSSFYIYDHKVYMLLRKCCEKNRYNEMEFRVQEIDTEHHTRQTLWSYQSIRHVIDEHLRKYINSFGKKYQEGTWVNNTSAGWYWNLDLSRLYANSQKVIFYFKVYCENDEGYSAGASMTIALDLKSGTWSPLEAGDALASQKSNLRIFSFDMLNNRMWYYFDQQLQAGSSEITLYSSPIGKTEELKKPDGKWELNRDSFLSLLRCPTYFDGAHLYSSPDYYTFYSYDKSGGQGEWNRSGHGSTDYFCILGPWVKPSLDAFFYEKKGEQDERFYPHSVDLPDLEACFVVPFDHIKNARRVGACGVPEAGDHSVGTSPSGAGREKAASITLDGFRQLIRSRDTGRESALAFRKSLSDRWDYNAVAGILAGTNKRHTTGILRELEQNLGIGQGDNKDSVVAKLREKGLEEIYSRYEKDTRTSLAAVEQEILNAVPEYAAIIDFINQTFL